MKSYLELKKEMKESGIDTKYFNRKFYDAFYSARLMVSWKIKNNIEDCYYKDGILLRHSYDAVYASDFYNKNSCSYCAFLELIA